jgi:UDP-glucose 4-epimerase
LSLRNNLYPVSEAYGEDFDDMERRVPDLSRIKNLIGYQPQKNLSMILHDMIEFEQNGLIIYPSIDENMAKAT